MNGEGDREHKHNSPGFSGMRQEIFEKKEEDNLARERIDRAEGGGVGVGGGLTPSHGRDFWDFWYQKQLF